MYATRRRKRNVKSLCKSSSLKDQSLHPSNPSKRHRERLNSELELLASLLPFDETVITKLDKLSILRLAVSYLRIKSHFQALSIANQSALDCQLHRKLHHRIQHGQQLSYERFITDSETVHQALSGFMIIITCSGEVFYVSDNVEQYLGFHQSDVIHQSALEFIHSEDRETFKSQLDWKHQMTTTATDGNESTTDMTLDQAFLPGNNTTLQRCFTARFRCLLDNASGFITLEVSGRIHKLLGQNSRENKEPLLALFALCCPFGPLPLDDVPPQSYAFTSKHKMDMSPISLDPRVQMLFGFNDQELSEKGGYDLIHPDDLTYFAAAHQELIKTGSSGLIAYRLMTKDQNWIWLQTSSRVIYKNAKPDHVVCISRCLTEDEGKDLARKRGSEFKLPFPIIVGDQAEFCAMLEHDLGRSKSPRTKSSRSQQQQQSNESRKRKYNNNGDRKSWIETGYGNGYPVSGDYTAWDSGSSHILKSSLSSPMHGTYGSGSQYTPNVHFRSVRASIAPQLHDDRQYDKYGIDTEACGGCTPDVEGPCGGGGGGGVHYTSDLLGSAVPGIGYIVSKAHYESGYGSGLGYRDQSDDKAIQYDGYDFRKYPYSTEGLSPLTGGAGAGVGGLLDGSLVHPTYRYGTSGAYSDGLFAWHDGIYHRTDLGLIPMDHHSKLVGGSQKEDLSMADGAVLRLTRGKENKTEVNPGVVKASGSSLEQTGSGIASRDLLPPPYLTNRALNAEIVSSYSLGGDTRQQAVDGFKGEGRSKGEEQLAAAAAAVVCDAGTCGDRILSSISTRNGGSAVSAFSPVVGQGQGKGGDSGTKVNGQNSSLDGRGTGGGGGGIATSVIQLSGTARTRSDEQVAGGVGASSASVPVLKSLGWPNNSPTYGWNPVQGSYGVYCGGGGGGGGGLRSHGGGAEAERFSPRSQDTIFGSTLIEESARTANQFKIVGFGENW